MLSCPFKIQTQQQFIGNESDLHGINILHNARIHGFQGVLTNLKSFTSSRVHVWRSDEYRINVQTEVLIRDFC